MEVRNLISAVNVKNGRIFFNHSKMLTFNLTVRCGCSYWEGYIHGSEDSRLLRTMTHVQKREIGSKGRKWVTIT